MTCEMRFPRRWGGGFGFLVGSRCRGGQLVAFSEVGVGSGCGCLLSAGIGFGRVFRSHDKRGANLFCDSGSSVGVPCGLCVTIDCIGRALALRFSDGVLGRGCPSLVSESAVGGYLAGVGRLGVYGVSMSDVLSGKMIASMSVACSTSLVLGSGLLSTLGSRMGGCEHFG